MKFAFTGDSILNGVVRDATTDRFHQIVERTQSADIALTHLETLIHDYDGPEVYPAAEAGWTWMRSPSSILDELKWMGFQGVTLASNHTLDYSYGGMKSTIAALQNVGMAHAGAGNDLVEASAPAIIGTDDFKVGVISMSSSFQPFSRAGQPRPDIKGRPGLNPLRFRYVADEEKLAQLKDMWKSMGWWILQTADDEWWAHPAGLHVSVTKVRLGDVDGLVTDVDPLDLERHRRSIEKAKETCDMVMVHVHNHEWDPKQGIHAPPEFAKQFARASVDAGCDLFVAEGGHASLRGIEVYKGKPVFYDPGDFFRMSDNVTKFPNDFFERTHFNLPNHETATVEEGILARKNSGADNPENPPGGYFCGKVEGGFVPILNINASGSVDQIALHPYDWSTSKEQAGHVGIPLAIDGAQADALIAYEQELSDPFGTTIRNENGVGIIDIP